MSLILEALKRSEAERRLGQAPGLLSPVPYGPQRRNRAPLAIALLATAVLAAGATWWLLRTDAPTAPFAGRELPSDPAVTGTPRAAPSAAQGEAASTVPSQAPPAAAPPAVPPPTAAVVTNAGPRLPDDPDFRSRERESLPVAATQAPPTAPHAARTAPPAPPSTPPDPSLATRSALQSVTQPATAAPAAAPSQQARTAAATGSDSPAALQEDDGPRLPRLRELPADTRAALPPLKFSMHVYADAPEERFVLIDGRRYGEGMSLADGLVLDEIRRDGTVLQFRGQRFLVPRPG